MMRRALGMLFALFAFPLLGESIYPQPPCSDDAPQTAWDRPACADYELNSSLIESLQTGDSSAAALLLRRHDLTLPYSERHRLAGALLGHVANDAKLWNELSEHATNAIRFADDEDWSEFEKWCEKRGFDLGLYWPMAVEALSLASHDRRANALLRRALETNDDDLIPIAIEGLGLQQDLSALALIEKTLDRRPDDASELAVGLHMFANEAADRLAMKYLSEEDRETFDMLRGGEGGLIARHPD